MIPLFAMQLMSTGFGPSAFTLAEQIQGISAMANIKAVGENVKNRSMNVAKDFSKAVENNEDYDMTSVMRSFIGF